MVVYCVRGSLLLCSLDAAPSNQTAHNDGPLGPKLASSLGSELREKWRLRLGNGWLGRRDHKTSPKRGSEKVRGILCLDEEKEGASLSSDKHMNEDSIPRIPPSSLSNSASKGHAHLIGPAPGSRNNQVL